MRRKEVSLLTALPNEPIQSVDTDGDGIVDELDNAPNVANPDQADTDGDGIGDVSDPDIDGDNLPNYSDSDPLDPSIAFAEMIPLKRDYTVSAFMDPSEYDPNIFSEQIVGLDYSTDSSGSEGGYIEMQATNREQISLRYTKMSLGNNVRSGVGFLTNIPRGGSYSVNVTFKEAAMYSDGRFYIAGSDTYVSNFTTEQEQIDLRQQINSTSIPEQGGLTINMGVFTWNGSFDNLYFVLDNGENASQGQSFVRIEKIELIKIN